MILTQNELIKVKGGGITASWFNYLTRAVEILFKIGRAVGSSLRRAYSRHYC